MRVNSFAILCLVSIIIVISDAEETAKAVKLAPKTKFSNGYEIPKIGLGTYESTGGDAEQAIKDAIDIGYRHIDSAFLYGNEVEVGNAVRAKIAEGKITREDMFITTKLWNTFHEPDQVEKAFQRSFDNLNLDYIDLYLLHYPVAYQRVLKNNRLPPDDVNAFHLFPVDKEGKVLHSDVDYLDTWKAMEKLVESGRVRSIGISNFNSQQVERIYTNSKIKPVANQVECHPGLNQLKLIEFCKARNISIIAYSPLGRRTALSDPKILELSRKYQKSPAQIVLRYTIQNGAIVIPKSVNKARIQENFNIFDFELSDSDMQLINGLNNNKRILDFASDKDNKYYPFNIEF